MLVIAYLSSVLSIVFSFFFFLALFKPNNGLPRNYPVVGMYVAFDLLGKSNGTFFFKGLWFTNTDMLLTSDPKNIHYITTTNFSNYPKGTDSKELFDFLGIALFNLDFEEWAFRTKALHAYLKQQQFHKFLNKVVVDNFNKGLIPVLEHVSTQGMVVDFVDVLERHLLDVAWLFCTGYKLDTLTVDFPENPLFQHA